jgi:hypothetical protein
MATLSYSWLAIFTAISRIPPFPSSFALLILETPRVFWIRPEGFSISRCVRGSILLVITSQLKVFRGSSIIRCHFWGVAIQPVVIIRKGETLCKSKPQQPSYNHIRVSGSSGGGPSYSKCRSYGLETPPPDNSIAQKFKVISLQDSYNLSTSVDPSFPNSPRFAAIRYLGISNALCIISTMSIIW